MLTISLMLFTFKSLLNLARNYLKDFRRSILFEFICWKKKSLPSVLSKIWCTGLSKSSSIRSSLDSGLFLKRFSSMPQYLSSTLSISGLCFYCSCMRPPFLIKSIMRLKAKGLRSIKTLSFFFCSTCRPEKRASRALPLIWHKVDFLIQKSSLPPTFNSTMSSIGWIYWIISISFCHSIFSLFNYSHSVLTRSNSLWMSLTIDDFKSSSYWHLLYKLSLN